MGCKIRVFATKDALGYKYASIERANQDFSIKINKFFGIDIGRECLGIFYLFVFLLDYSDYDTFATSKHFVR